uniref:Glucose-methanol-choline oxidoreductase N-terminal domain-containing protein n=1 Tax=Bionectria ochroleuca TaxID=29856 RepID=A0A8H7K1V9_BIOOC
MGLCVAARWHVEESAVCCLGRRGGHSDLVPNGWFICQPRRLHRKYCQRIANCQRNFRQQHSPVVHLPLCENCVNSTVTNLANETPILGWAISAENPTTVTDSASALNYHAAGFGQYGLNIAAAKSSKYATWASWASSGTTPTPPGTTPGTPGGNSTLPTPITSNVTYDTIVVGGGPAGIIAAERIAESGASVLLIERGPANTVALGSSLGLPWNSSLTPTIFPVSEAA